MAYLLHTTGELCLSPVGLSAVTKLAVPSVVGVMMGTWFLASAYSSYVAAQIATIAARPANEGSLNLTDALSGYTELFSQLLTIGLAGGAVLLVLSPVLEAHDARRAINQIEAGTASVASSAPPDLRFLRAKRICCQS